MFDIAPSELLLVAIVALVVIGPKDLPKALRVAGYWVGKARGVARQFRQGFDSMVREAELEEMEKRWATENARIMAEHPSPAAEEAHDVAPVMVEKPAVTPDPALPAAPEHGEADITPPRSEPAAVADLFASHDRRETTPPEGDTKDVAPS